VRDDPVSLGDIEGVPVHAGGKQIGTVSGVYLDQGLARVVGLEVAAVDGRRSFVPWVAVTFQGRVVDIESRLLLGGGQVDYDARHGACLSGNDTVPPAVFEAGEIEHPGASGDTVLAAA